RPAGPGDTAELVAPADDASSLPSPRSHGRAEPITARRAAVSAREGFDAADHREQPVAAPLAEVLIELQILEDGTGVDRPDLLGGLVVEDHQDDGHEAADDVRVAVGHEVHRALARGGGLAHEPDLALAPEHLVLPDLRL